MELSEQFYLLFKGSDIAYGTYVVNGSRDRDGKKQGTAKVIREPPTAELWEQHLKGGTGLGIIPIRSDNTCQWGAIDIDEYDVDHIALVNVIRSHKIPAIVGRTKSGGAHVWVFLKEPVEAVDMQRRMTELAAALGFAGSEIFPKQTTILLDRGDTGNFLNMPYHSSKNSTRYAFDDEGKGLTAEQFMEYVQPYITSPSNFHKLDFSFGIEKEEHLDKGPPCLQHLWII